MAPKRASPLDDPPTASSSDSEEDSEALSHDEQPSSQKRQQEKEEDASSEELEEDDDDDEEEEDDDDVVAPPPPPATKSQPLATNSHSQPSSSESATESDSDSDPPTSTVAVNPKVRPLSSKRMEETPKPKPQPSAMPAKSASKRPSENNGHLIDPKRAKKNVTDAASDDDDDDDQISLAAAKDGKKSGDDSKKQFQRLWSEEDEIAILKGMVEFPSKTGMDPHKDANAFYDFVKKSLHADATSNQLKQKIRRLKKKFEVNSGKGKNGEEPSFTKPHDQKAFELSKKVWAKDGGAAANGVVERLEKAKSNGKARNNSQKEGKKNVASPKPKAETLPLDSRVPEKMDIHEKRDATLHLSEMIRFDKGLGLPGLNEDVVKRGLELIGASKRAELEQRWKKLQVTELELYAKRAELIQDQARLILEAYKASNH